MKTFFLFLLLPMFLFANTANIDSNYKEALTAYKANDFRTSYTLLKKIYLNKLEMARTYFMLKMYEDSQNLYSDVLSNPNIPSNIRRNIELSLSRVSKVQKKSFTYATIKAEILYDSNINYGNIGSLSFDETLLPATQKIYTNCVYRFRC